MYVCEECFILPGVAYVEGFILCEICFVDIFGIPWDDVKQAKFCQSCEAKALEPHVCKASSVDAETFIKGIKVKEDGKMP
jgi:hypothetical protein